MVAPGWFRRSRVAAVALAAAGMALLVWQVRAAGADDIAAGLAAVGLWFGAILALSLLRFAARARAWTTLMDGGPGLGTATAASIAGDALGNLTPLGVLLSEPAKAVLVRGPVTAAHALAALAAENLFYSVSVAVVVVLGTAALLGAFALPTDLVWASWLLVAGMLALLVAAGWVVWRRPAVAGRALGRLPFDRVRAAAARLQAFEDDTYRLLRARPGSLAAVAGLEAGFHLLSFLEAYLTLWLLTGASLPLEAFILDTVNRVINVVFKMVPLRLGVDEVGTSLVAQAIGVGAAPGVTLALVRKGRLLVWAAFGLVWLALRKQAAARP